MIGGSGRVLVAVFSRKRERLATKRRHSQKEDVGETKGSPLGFRGSRLPSKSLVKQFITSVYKKTTSSYITSITDSLTSERYPLS